MTIKFVGKVLVVISFVGKVLAAIIFVGNVLTAITDNIWWEDSISYNIF